MFNDHGNFPPCCNGYGMSVVILDFLTFCQGKTTQKHKEMSKCKHPPYTPASLPTHFCQKAPALYPNRSQVYTKWTKTTSPLGNFLEHINHSVLSLYNNLTGFEGERVLVLRCTIRLLKVDKSFVFSLTISNQMKRVTGFEWNALTSQLSTVSF